jgi:hypothetical protein
VTEEAIGGSRCKAGKEVAPQENGKEVGAHDGNYVVLGATGGGRICQAGLE